MFTDKYEDARFRSWHHREGWCILVSAEFAPTLLLELHEARDLQSRLRSSSMLELADRLSLALGDAERGIVRG